MKRKLTDTYNQLANDYEHNVDTKNLYNIEYERPVMMSLLPTNVEAMSIFDAGCAAGWYSLQLADRGAQVIATDISPNMVAAAKRRVGERAEVHCLDLEGKLPFKDATFDYIISSLVLHYIKNWSITFSEFKRVLKPNGKLIFSIHHPFMDIKLSDSKDYFSTELIIDKWEREAKEHEVPFFRRPLHEIINETHEHFIIEKLIEPQPTSEFKLVDVKGYEKLMKTPHFLIIQAINK